MNAGTSKSSTGTGEGSSIAQALAAGAGGFAEERPAACTGSRTGAGGGGAGSGMDRLDAPAAARRVSCGKLSRWNPVAITVIFTSSFIASFRTTPKLICASSLAVAPRISEQASFTSCRLSLLDPVMLISTPRAPLTPPSSMSGELMAWRAASMEAFSPLRRRGAHHRVAHAQHDGADVGEVAIDQAGRGDDVADALHGLAQNVVGDAERFEEAGAAGNQFEQTVVGNGDDGVHRAAESRRGPRSACFMRRGPSKANGLVTTATVRAFNSLASEATTGAAPVPVPPPRPAVTNTMSAPSSTSMIRSVSSSAACWPTRGIGSRAQAVGHLGANGQFVGDRRSVQRLHVGVENVELDARESLVHHAGDGVRSAAADADHLDLGSEQSLFLDGKFQRVHSNPPVSAALLIIETTAPSDPGAFRLPLAFSFQARGIFRESRGRGPHRAQQFIRQILDAGWQRIARRAIQHTLGHVAHAVEQRAAAGQDHAFEQLLIHADGHQLRAHMDKQLFGARFQNFVQLLARRFRAGRPSGDGTSISCCRR